jgi:hypothetical protein
VVTRDADNPTCLSGTVKNVPENLSARVWRLSVNPPVNGKSDLLQTVTFLSNDS